MDNRDHALDILYRARDILSERLIEALADSGEEIMDDARGVSFSSEIEAIHEQIGSRLANVNALIGQLQPLELIEEFVMEQGPLELVDDDESGVAAPFVQTDTAIVSVIDPASPAPANPSRRPANSDRCRSGLEAFVERIGSGDEEGASTLLAQLFQIDESRARESTRLFAERFASTANISVRVLKLNLELQSGSFDTSLELLKECFNLQGGEAIGAARALKARMLDSH